MFSRRFMRRHSAAMASLSCVLVVGASPFALQMQAASAAPPQQPIRGVLLPPPDAPSTEQALLETWETIYEVLFDRPLDMESASLTLDTSVTATGQTQGQNEFGDSFQLNVRSVLSADIAQANLPPEDLALALSQNVTFAYIEAVAITPLGQLTLGGFAMSRTPDAQTLESVFVPFEIITHLIQTSLDLPGFGMPAPICIPYPEFCNDDPEQCADDCLDAYNDAVQQAKDHAESQQAQALIQYLIDINNALFAKLAETTDAIAEYDAAMEICLIGDVVGHIVSQLTSWIPFVGQGVSLVAFLAAIDCAQQARSGLDEAIENANADFEADVANAESDHTSTMAIIQMILEGQLEDAEEALDECREDCYAICGWSVHCIFIRLLVF